MSRSIPDFWRSLWRFLDELPQKRAFQAALALWIILATVVAIIVAVQPDRRTATLEYQKASARWWGGEESLYTGKNGYLYLPQAAILYTPYELLPDRVGEPLWRLTCIGLLALATALAARHISPEKAGTLFLIATVLLLPSALSSSRNGQVNMPLAAIYMLTAIAISRDRWHLAALMLAVSLALKPISIVPVLLCGALYPKLRLPLLAWIGAMLALAFANPDTKYVLGQYEEFFSKMTRAGKPKNHDWCDFAGMLRTFGLHLSDTIHLGIRAIMAVVTLGLSWWALRAGNTLRSALTMMLFSVIYLMLFNPRTETNSYIILGIFVGLLGAYEGLVRKDLAATGIWVAFAIVLGSENYGWPIFPLTNLWLKALVTLALGVWLAVRVIRAPKGTPVIFRPPSLA